MFEFQFFIFDQQIHLESLACSFNDSFEGRGKVGKLFELIESIGELPSREDRLLNYVSMTNPLLEANHVLFVFSPVSPQPV